MNSHFTTPTSNLYNIVQPQAQAVAETLTDINFHTNLTKAQRRMLGESEAARVKRLAKNAERMRQKRASETFDEYKLRLAKNAESNRKRRQNETETERSLRHMRNAMRQRLRRAMETPEQKEIRKARLAQRMREVRANETPEQRKIRLEKGAARARHKFLSETSEERAERNRKKAEYARSFRSTKNLQVKSFVGKSIESKTDVKAQCMNNTTIHQTQNTDLMCREQSYTQVKNYSINYNEFVAFPTFLNYSHLKNGHHNTYPPAYPSQTYYPDFSASTHMKSDRMSHLTPKGSEDLQLYSTTLKETPQKD
ncbi:uncharacterized protein C05D11.13-like isoform X1 [Wyeomyia smithii]|uniref:uncharacterized protein C05D11.13-like isoform X1 n=1 Tax=Wyeomyia smithii TaxID=174621 RepID=UPI002467C5CE|nr:uncharacterized protein C05D11.13-like isoform X1 [Wyeomyia smithii]XP_055544478.1 uncharacterized protein C05D11.13-like isoform X1 [Wyeomyia smithii]XP_055544479.1 uncharacterized protein C05D11.13-like isoform X1 [Wyeomyia smithii]XP_055544480.1 uncharacterized protein C05D11.13-like isoform X1 [Wyeomyia smithii]